MRLIHTRLLVLEEYFGDQIPKYAILSHRWRDEEVTYQDWQHNQRGSAEKKGFRKIKAACIEAQRRSIEYLWVDTICINKDSSSELGEAINSMFSWYEHSSICFVYLDDFHFERNGSLAGFGTSQWFTRGWTLQELLGPRTVQFFDASWTPFGTKHSLLLEISKATSIHIQYLMYPDSIRLASVARRMSWVATRSTTREEDIAYCLLGIFHINMPLLYGEGAKAFIRLQEEIIRHSNDHTIFCWSWAPSMEPAETPGWNGCLAPRPVAFRDSGDFFPTHPATRKVGSDFQLTNSGLRINLPLLDSPLDEFKLAMLSAKSLSNDDSRICLCLQKISLEGFARSRFPNRLLSVPRSWFKGGVPVYLAHERDPGRKISTFVVMGSIAAFPEPKPYAIFPILSAHGLRASPISYHSWPRSSGYSGAALLLYEGDEENQWYTQLEVGNSKNALIKFNFKAWIKQPQGGVWDATMQIQHQDTGPENETQAITQHMTLSHNYDFTISGHGEPTLVRPVLLSFSEFLGTEDGNKK